MHVYIALAPRHINPLVGAVQRDQYVELQPVLALLGKRALPPYVPLVRQGARLRKRSYSCDRRHLGLSRRALPKTGRQHGFVQLVDSPFDCLCEGCSASAATLRWACVITLGLDRSSSPLPEHYAPASIFDGDRGAFGRSSLLGQPESSVELKLKL
ncbi:MAG TPA: hypothetical protein VNL96_06445 [Gemmatimonadaceae bacterium]|nr:hypothetical protein [Gemmatimonadaceae bacterium]